MAIQDVRGEWPTYRLLTKAVYVGINDPNSLDTAVANIGSLPSDPGEWDDWLHALAFIVGLHNAVAITNAALQQQAIVIAATNKIAAAVQLPGPGQADVTSLINQLQIVNAAIQQDQRFHEALKIGKALAANLDGTFKK